MRDTTHDHANMQWKNRVDVAWREALGEVLKRGFHGRANVEVHVTDGTIFRVTRIVERVEK